MENLAHTFIETNGISLHVILAGEKDRPPLILLHGYPEFWYGWIHQIDPLASAGYNLLVPDQRGYNLSDKPKKLSAYRLDTLAADILGLIDSTGQERASLIGHDWGGLVAWHLAEHYPQRVDRMVILNAPHPAVFTRHLRRSPLQWLRSFYAFFFQIPALPEWFLRRDHWKNLVQGMIRTSRPGTFSEEMLDHYREAWSQPGAMTAMINWYRQAGRSRIRQILRPPALPRISVPTLILWGAKDFALARKLAKISAALCDEGQLVFFEKATHWVQHEEAKAVNELILEFLSKPAW